MYNLNINGNDCIEELFNNSKLIVKDWKYSSKGFEHIYKNQNSLAHLYDEDFFNQKRFYSEISGLSKAKNYPLPYSYQYSFYFYGKKDKEEILEKHILIYKNFINSNNYNSQIAKIMKSLIGNIIYGYYWENTPIQNKIINDMIEKIEI